MRRKYRSFLWGSLTLSSPDKTSGSEAIYRVDQNILRAEVTSTLKLGKAIVHLRSWTADGENVLVTEVQCDAKSPAPARILLELAMPPQDDSLHTLYPSAAGERDGVLWANRENNLTGVGDYQAKAALALRVFGSVVTHENANPNSANEAFLVKPGAKTWIAIVFKSDARIGSGGRTAAQLTASAIQSVRLVAQIPAAAGA
jgi:hypothetical protein